MFWGVRSHLAATAPRTSGDRNSVGETPAGEPYCLTAVFLRRYRPHIRRFVDCLAACEQSSPTFVAGINSSKFFAQIWRPTANTAKPKHSSYTCLISRFKIAASENCCSKRAGLLYSPFFVQAAALRNQRHSPLNAPSDITRRETVLSFRATSRSGAIRRWLPS